MGGPDSEKHFLPEATKLGYFHDVDHVTIKVQFACCGSYNVVFLLFWESQSFRQADTLASGADASQKTAE